MNIIRKFIQESLTTLAETITLEQLVNDPQLRSVPMDTEQDVLNVLTAISTMAQRRLEAIDLTYKVLSRVGNNAQLMTPRVIRALIETVRQLGLTRNTQRYNILNAILTRAGVIRSHWREVAVPDAQIIQAIYDEIEPQELAAVLVNKPKALIPTSFIEKVIAKNNARMIIGVINAAEKIELEPMAKLHHHKSEMVRAALARRQDLYPDLAELFLMDDSERVRMTFAKNPITATKDFNHLIQHMAKRDPSPTVRAYASKIIKQEHEGIEPYNINNLELGSLFIDINERPVTASEIRRAIHYNRNGTLKNWHGGQYTAYFKTGYNASPYVSRHGHEGSKAIWEEFDELDDDSDIARRVYRLTPRGQEVADKAKKKLHDEGRLDDFIRDFTIQ